MVVLARTTIRGTKEVLRMSDRIGGYRCMVCHRTHKPFESFEHVLWLDINHHFHRHHPDLKEQIEQNVEVYVNGVWVKPKSVLVDDQDISEVRLKKRKVLA
jgi:hypothetical protein